MSKTQPSSNPVGDQIDQLDATLKSIVAPAPAPPVSDFERSTSRYARAIYLAVACGFGGVIAASAVIPVASGVVAGGRVVVANNRKVVQHLEGGIVEQVMVKEGQSVVAGQPLIRLRDVPLRAVWSASDRRYWELRATKARLDAQRAGQRRIIWPEDMMRTGSDAEIASVKKDQEAVFQTAVRQTGAATGMLQSEVAQKEAELLSLQAQLHTAQGRLALVQGRLDELRPVYERGYITRSRMLELETDEQSTSGALEQLKAEIQRVGHEASEARLRLTQARTAENGKFSDEQDNVNQQLAEMTSRRGQAQDALDRSLVRSPASGRVMGLTAHTIGGVLTPGEKIMEIVPQTDQLVVQAAINPSEISHIHDGMAAKVKLSGVHSRSLPDLRGVVTIVSPDVTSLPPQAQERDRPYYDVRVEIDPKSLAPYRGISLVPGMPAQVTMNGGKRTMLDYLLGPVGDVMARTFKEY